MTISHCTQIAKHHMYREKKRQFIMNRVGWISGAKFKRCERSQRIVEVTEIVLEKVGVRLCFEDYIRVE